MTASSNSPVFWRDERMPHVELRKVDDGRTVCYALHSHEHWSLGAITNGISTFIYREDSFAVSAGDLVLMNPHWAHACNPINDQPWAYLMMYVDTQWLTDLRFRMGLLEAPRWQDLHTAVLSESNLYDGFCQLADCLLDRQCVIEDKQARLEVYLSELMCKMSDQPDISQQPAADTLVQVARYLDHHLTENISLQTLCALSGYSASHLIRSFRQAFGFTPHAYVLNRRIQLGQSELKQGISIADAALNAGFADQPHFQRAFKQRVAATPNQYRLGSAK